MRFKDLGSFAEEKTFVTITLTMRNCRKDTIEKIRDEYARTIKMYLPENANTYNCYFGFGVIIHTAQKLEHPIKGHKYGLKVIFEYTMGIENPRAVETIVSMLNRQLDTDKNLLQYKYESHRRTFEYQYKYVTVDYDIQKQKGGTQHRTMQPPVETQTIVMKPHLMFNFAWMETNDKKKGGK